MDSLAHLHGMTWEQWRDAFEAHHEHLRSTVEGFEGYGPSPIMADTGEECWRGYWEDGYTPENALAEDMTYWED